MEISDRRHTCYTEITDRMTPTYVYHKPLMIKFPDKHEKQNGFTPNNKGELVWYTEEPKTNKGTGTGLHRWGLRRGHYFSIGLHATVFQAKMCAIKAYAMENTEDNYKGRNIYSLSDNQAAIKALDNFQRTSNLVWDCQLKQAEQERIQLVWWLGYMGIDENEIADQ